MLQSQYLLRPGTSHARPMAVTNAWIFARKIFKQGDAQGSRVVDVSIGERPEGDVEAGGEGAPGGHGRRQWLHRLHQLLPAQPRPQRRCLYFCRLYRTWHISKLVSLH